MTGCVRSCTSQLFAGSIVTLNRVDAAMILGSGGLSRSSITQDDTSWVNGGLGVSLGVNVPGGWRRDHEAPVQCLEPCVKRNILQTTSPEKAIASIVSSGLR